MSKKQEKEAQPGVEPVAPGATPRAEDVLAVDEHAGKGGSFIFDPVTGARTRVAADLQEGE